MSRVTLGGRWRTVTLVGGWWCTASASRRARDERSVCRRAPVPVRTATPAIRSQAVRDAKQGRAVTCFFVDASGLITKPEIIEISDEIFRAPTLSALARSQYQGWDDASSCGPVAAPIFSVSTRFASSRSGRLYYSATTRALVTATCTSVVVNGPRPVAQRCPASAGSSANDDFACLIVPCESR